MVAKLRLNKDEFWYITALDGPWQVYSSRKRGDISTRRDTRRP